MAPRPSPPPSAHPEVEAASRPDASMVEAKTGPSSSTPPPPPAGFSPPSQVEPDASTGGTAVTSLTVSSSSADEDHNASRTEMTDAVPPEQQQQQPRPRAPYAIPDWSAAPEHPFFLEVVEEGISYGVLDVSKKGAYMFGQSGLCDFVLDHSSIARFHAVLQFRNDGEVFLYDLGSTHGSSINKTQISQQVVSSGQ